MQPKPIFLGVRRIDSRISRSYFITAMPRCHIILKWHWRFWFPWVLDRFKRERLGQEAGLMVRCLVITWLFREYRCYANDFFTDNRVAC